MPKYITAKKTETMTYERHKREGDISAPQDRLPLSELTKRKKKDGF